ncbi:CAU/MBL1b family subclass B3 metallo-beta-lactamase [Arenicella chitinivorans]|uniref:CAU/MBL1b family subclass B3 metallo-beta-lactamase n=1 Tax=Arenicella chitinivorans TaxID=1329800 RepID=A0A918RLZ8_9GAMM|nr:subclass B3 metallo-beta-lactamase [Arenicella chitinivorans]GHA03579.1 CAU/MBL1b family subclass B3 metallo-beta-lactamase [Arenicella chitinivorans]
MKILTALLFLCTLIIDTPKSALADEAISTPHNQNAWVEACDDWDDWDKPGPPFKVYGNTYYVGTCGISALLITGETGHILIDGGTEAGAAVIAANVQALGFELRDIELLLHSHEHFDHVAGLAELQKISGARLLASAAAAPVLSSGIVAANDPQAGMHDAFPAANVDDIVDLTKPVILGALRLQAHATPGHTHGALSWQWQSCEQSVCVNLVYADSLSPVSRDDYRFNDHLEYLAAYRRGLANLASLDCQLVLAPHPSAAKMRTRLLSKNGLVDNTACQDYASGVLKRLDKRLEKERASLSSDS